MIGRLAGFLLLTIALVHVEAADPPRPNVVVLLADDLGYSDLACYGGEIDTPNLDALAAEGLRFTQFTNTARCWPSRAALLTGYYAQQVNRDPMALRPKWASLVPQLLAPAGYRSYHSGKWHVDGPVLAGGFERSYWIDDYNRNFNPKVHYLDDVPLPPVAPGTGYYTTTEIASRSIEWLDLHDREHAGAPFFLYVAFMSPHFPLHAPAADVAKYRGRFAEGWDALRAQRLARMTAMGLLDCVLSERTPGVPAWDTLSAEERGAWETRMEVHAAMVDRIDQEVGRVVDRLRKSNQLNNTLILFLSDNGASHEKLVRGDGHDPAAPPGSAATFQCIEPGWANLANAPLRKSKMFVHEGGIATPLIAHWPAGITKPGALRHTPGHVIDFAPTFLELAGVAAPSEWGGEMRPTLPGRSLAPTFAADVPIAREALFYKHMKNRALRQGDWKIVSSDPEAPWELYNLATDRSETTDLAPKQPDRVAAMAEAWRLLDEEYARQGATGQPLPKPAAR